jgi:iron(III)-enterobactin esterase
MPEWVLVREILFRECLGGDAQGSERGLEYDTMSGTYAEFVESEVLPRVEAEAHVKLTGDPDGRATIGGSSGAAYALIMA